MKSPARPSPDPRMIPQLIGGSWLPADQTYDVFDPYRKQLVARVARSAPGDLERAMSAAVAAKGVMAAMPGFERAALLRRLGVLLDQRVDRIAEVMSREMGKAIKDARGEVARLAGHHPAFGGRGGAHRRRAGRPRSIRDGCRQVRLPVALSGRCRRRHHALQCPIQSGFPQGCAGARIRQCDRAQGVAARPGRRPRARLSVRRSGQSCISVQNVYVHDSLNEAFVARVVDEVKTLKVGDPLDPAIDVGTLVDEAAARRVEAWIREAAAAGAKVLTGGARDGAQVEPTVIVDVTPDMRVVCEEVFGPVISIQQFSDVETVLRAISASRFGLQCGLFTKSMDLAFHAIRSLRTGGLILNGTSTWRTYQLAYGGIKDSGIGREGPKYAIKDMTDERLVVFNL